MAITETELAASIRAYRDRDWGSFERLRKNAHAASRRRDGIIASLRVMDELRASALAVRPDWPTEADREADYQNHLRVVSLFARTAPYFEERNRRAPQRSTVGSQLSQRRTGH